MLFSSYGFVFVFLPLCITGYFLLSKLKSPLWQRLFLIAASLVFYGWGYPSCLPLLLVSLLVNFLLARGVSRGGRLGLLCFLLGILLDVGTLVYYKYANLILSGVEALFSVPIDWKQTTSLPGVSFFTFQQLVYLILLRQKKTAVGSLADYATFVLFFPQLVSGPIVLYDEIAPAFAEESRRYPCAKNLAVGAYLFCIGLFMKLACANSAASLSDMAVYYGELGLIGAWAGTLSYTMQIYFDFGGYAMMALGVGRMFNIRLPINFDRPYASASVTEFWRRWHITLGRALSVCVYRPLGGSRHGKIRTCCALFVTMLVSGIWHGANQTFLIWGALNGLILVFERLMDGILKRIPRVLRQIGTFLTVNALWVLFRAESLSAARDMWRSLINVSDLSLSWLVTLSSDSTVGYPAPVRIAYVVILLIALIVFSLRLKNADEIEDGFSLDGKHLLIALAAFVLAVLHMNRESVFIYYFF